jgi:hypothetical protein
MSFTPSRSRAACFAVFLGSAAFLLGAPSAQAGPLVDQAVSCDSYTFQKPFAQWEDPLPFDYVLAPDGGLERRARNWQLSGGARVVNGNERYYVNRRADIRSLYLRAGSSATSPAMCAGVTYPTLRMFARVQGSSASTLKVEMLYEDSTGAAPPVPLQPFLGWDGVLGQPILDNALTASSRWNPTLPMALPTALLLPATLSPWQDPDHPGTAAIAFRFTPQGSATWWIDDVYVDPYRRY